MFLRFELKQIVKSRKDEEQASLINKKACRETSAFYKTSGIVLWRLG